MRLFLTTLVVISSVATLSGCATDWVNNGYSGYEAPTGSGYYGGQTSNGSVYSGGQTSNGPTYSSTHPSNGKYAVKPQQQKQDTQPSQYSSQQTSN